MASKSRKREGRKRTALVELLAELDPPEDLALLRIAQLAVEPVAEAFLLEEFASLCREVVKGVPSAVIAGLCASKFSPRSSQVPTREAPRTIENSPRMKLSSETKGYHDASAVAKSSASTAWQPVTYRLIDVMRCFPSAQFQTSRGTRSRCETAAASSSSSSTSRAL